MSGVIKRSVLVCMAVTMLVGNAWGGWFSFEPNILILDGTPVARELEDIEKETAYRKTGDVAQADQLIKDSRVLIMESQKYDTRVEYIKYKEKDGNVFVLVADESGTKMWANINGLACCQGDDGKQRNITKEDLDEGKFPPLKK